MSIIVDYKKIVADISKNPKLYEVYMQEFPEFKDQINEIKKKPDCEGCLMKNLPPFLAHKDAASRLALIYGSDAQINLSPPKPPAFMPTYEVKEVPYTEYAEWFEENMRITPERRVQFYNAFAMGDKVIVSMIVLQVKQ